MTAARVTMRPESATVALTYDPAIVQAIKDAVPTWARRYDAATRTWTIDQSYAEPVVRLLRARLGPSNVEVTGRPDQSSATPPAESADWAEVLFARLPARLREPTYRAMIRILHPDADGDGRLAQQLNDSFRRVTGTR